MNQTNIPQPFQLQKHQEPIRQPERKHKKIISWRSYNSELIKKMGHLKFQCS